MNDIFICTTPYHLLITIMKVVLNNEEGFHDLIISHLDNFSTETLQNIQQHSLFKSILLCSPKYNYQKKRDFLYHKLGFVSKRLFSTSPLPVEYFRNRDIFIFHDLTYFGQLFNAFKIPYNLIEDCCNLFKINIPGNRSIPFWHLFCKIRGIHPLGLSPLIKQVEVNDVNNLLLKRNNIIEKPRAIMFSSLTTDQKRKLCAIFGLNQEKWQIKPNSTLLLTQPLSEDGLMTHDEKIKLYKHLVNKYGLSNIFIKPHPREIEEYEKIFPNGIVFKENKIPLELLNFLSEYEFGNVITAFSSAIYSEIRTKEKFYFGYKETIDFVKSLR